MRRQRDAHRPHSVENSGKIFKQNPFPTFRSFHLAVSTVWFPDPSSSSRKPTMAGLPQNNRVLSVRREKGTWFRKQENKILLPVKGNEHGRKRALKISTEFFFFFTYQCHFLNDIKFSSYYVDGQ